MSVKVHRCAELALNAVAAGMCAVIGLQTTGEAAIGRAMDEAGGAMDGYDGLVSAPAQVLRHFVSTYVPKVRAAGGFYGGFMGVCGV